MADTNPIDPSADDELIDSGANDAPEGGEGAGVGDDNYLTEKERDQLSLQSSAFEALERDFREVLNELVGDKSLERFRLEYEKLHHTLKKSHENEKRLIKKCRELNNEIVANASKIKTALRLSQQDQNSITLLKKEIDKAWKMVDGAQEKEKRSRERIQILMGEIKNLTKLVDQGAGLSIGQENAVNELLKIKEDLTKEVQRHVRTISENKEKIGEMEQVIVDLQQKSVENDHEITELKDKMAKLKNEAQREIRRAERLQQEMLTIKEVNDQRKAALMGEQENSKQLKIKLTEMEVRQKQLDSDFVRCQHINTQLKTTNEDLEKKIDAQMQLQQDIMQEKEEADQEIMRMRREIKKKQQEFTGLKKLKEKAEKDKDRMGKGKEEAERYKNWLKEEMKNVLKSVESQRKDADTDEKLIKELQQQVKRMTSALHISQEKNNFQFKLVEDHEGIISKLEDDIRNNKVEATRLRKQNYQLEKQREKAAVQASMWHQRFLEAQEGTKLKEMEVTELQKNIQEEKNKLKLQQNLYEQVRSDRNLFSKQQVQSEDEIAEMKRKFKIMTHQIDQLKEEIQTKDAALINEHFAYKRLQDEMKVNKRKLAKRREVLATADQVLASQDAEIKNLRRTLNEAEAAQHQQKRVYDDVVQERDILGTQLIRRNDELALLYEKIRIQHSTLCKGEVQYRDRLLDVKALKLELTNVKRQLQIRNHEVTNIDALKNEVYHVQRELLQERTKVKALSEELENPMNVHRWRKLEGSDPKRYELVQKIHTLQSRLISKTEEVVEKDLLLQEKEKLYTELKNLLARQPGPEVAEQLSVYQHSLKDKTKQMKAMAAELNMFQAQVNEYKYEIERVTRELQDVKRKYFEQRRKEQGKSLSSTGGYDDGNNAGDNGDIDPNDPLLQQQHQFHSSQPKIAGGGFNLTAPAAPQLQPQN